jgi:REP element-mobilizing transposase RayT
MANTYTQLYIHFVFAPKYRAALLNPEWDERLRLYITAIVQNNDHKVLAINNMPDHLHLFIGLNPKQSISELMQMVKVSRQNGSIRSNLLNQNSIGRKDTEHLAIPAHKLIP